MMMNGLYIRSGYLTPHGAMLDIDQGGTSIHEWRDGLLHNMGQADSDSLKVRGGFAAWTGPTTTIAGPLMRRDLTTATTIEILPHHGGLPEFGICCGLSYDLAANGNVVYAAYELREQNGAQVLTSNIFRYRDGVTTQITGDAARINFNPRTDGEGITYLKANSSPTAMPAMYLYTAGEETKIVDNIAGDTYLYRHPIREGWVAYTQPGGQGQAQVWVRSPTGERQQVTFFGAGSGLDLLGPNGTLTVYSTTGLYYSATRPTLTRIGGGHGRRVWIDGQLYTILGRSLFRVLLP
jgi:hypothetical protein